MTQAIVACTSVSEYVEAVVCAAANARGFLPVLVAEDDGRVQELAAFAGTVVVPWRSMKQETAVSPAEQALVRDVVAALHSDSEVDRTRALMRLGNGADDVDSAPHAAKDLVIAIDDSYALFGAALARFEARPFRMMDTRSAVAEQALGARSVAIVGEPRNFGPQAVGRLMGYEGAAATATMKAPFGIVTGHSRSSVSRTITKKLLYSNHSEAQRLLSIFDRPIHERREGALELLSLLTLDAAQASRLVDENFALVAIGTHGDPIDADLNESVLCGRSNRMVTNHRSLVQVHTCSNEDHCPRNRGGTLQRIAVDALRARFLAIETCTGIGIAEGLFPSSLSLALGALEGLPAAFLSTTKIIRGTGIGPLLIPLLAQRGLPFGEICEIMKLAHVGVSGDFPSFVLLGDPTSRLVEQSAPLPRVAGTLDLSSPRRGDSTPRWTLSTKLGPAPTSVVWIDVTGAEAEDVALRDGVALEGFSAEPATPEPGAETIALVARDVFGTPLSVLLFAARPFELSSVRLSLVDDRGARDDVERAIAEVEDNLFLMRAIQKTAAHAKGILATPEREKQATDLSLAIDEGEGILAEATTALHARRFPVHSLPLPWSTPDVGAWLATKLASLDASLTSNWSAWNMRHFLVPQYGTAFVACGRERVAAPCYLCGGTLFEVTMRAQRRPTLARTVSHCSRCTIVSDRPSTEAIVEIRGPATVRRGERLEQRLLITNPANEERSFAAAGSVEGAHAWLRGQVEPSSTAAVVAAAGTSEVALDVVIGESTSPGTYNCVFMTMSRLAINVSVKAITVSD